MRFSVIVDMIFVIGKTADMTRPGRSESTTGAELAETQRSGAFRILAIIVIAVLLAAEVARLTIAAAVADDDPAFANRLAPFSPASLISNAMGQVGTAAARGEDVSRPTLDALRLASDAAPLRTEPFLVQAAIAERKGDFGRAESLLGKARWREPRSPATLYLLADVWLRQNKVVPGLRQLALLSRIMPATSVQLVPALADYARTPGAPATLNSILASNPELRRPLLTALSADPDNADLALALAGPDLRSSEASAQAWKSRLLAGLVKRGDYGHAYVLWRNFAGVAPGFSALLFNSDFKPLPAPPPFNWSYTAGSAGITEPANGQLRILFYGKNEQSLASQLLLLQPGNYRFEAPVSGNAAPGALVWTLRCSPDGKPIMQLPLASGAPGARFAVPADCPAQKLEIRGHSEDMPQDSDVQIGPVRLERVPA